MVGLVAPNGPELGKLIQDVTDYAARVEAYIEDKVEASEPSSLRCHIVSAKQVVGAPTTADKEITSWTQPPYFEVVIKGGNTTARARALVDTGSSITVITSRMVKELGLPLVKAEDGLSFATANQQSVNVYHTTNFTLMIDGKLALELTKVAV